jgi:sec-independent protein translocase protein TatC
LRDRLVRALIAVGIAFAALAYWPGPAGACTTCLASPLVATLPQGATMIATNVISPFLVPLKITLMAAFLLALPIVLYQVWAFVAPGLYSHEKKLVLPLVISSTLLFVAGVAFCYFFVFGQVFKFIQGFAPKSITAARTSRPTWASCSPCSSPSVRPSRCRWWWWCWRAWAS